MRMNKSFIIILTIITLTRCETMIPTLVSGDQEGSNSSSDNALSGKIRINGYVWETTCDCSKDHDEAQKSACNPSNMKIFRDKTGNGLGFRKVRKLIGNIKDYSWTKVSKASFTCVDGRVSYDSLSTPGGDAGEFLLALHTYQNYFGSAMKMSDQAIDRIFRRYLDHMDQEKFTMCTDDISVGHLEKQLTTEGIDLESPRDTIQEKLLESLMEPLNMGDLHMRLMMKNYNMYNIDPELIKKFLKSFYNNLWNNEKSKKKIKLEVLVGKHNEKAFLEIKSNAICTKDDLAPLMKQKQRKTSVFMNHIDAVQIRRAQLAYFFANVVNMHQDPINTDKLFNMINEQGMSFLEITGSYIGKELPFYSINIL